MQKSTGMKIEELKPGMYVISKNVKNPKPDRRHADRNFEKKEIWEKGMRVCVMEDYEFVGNFKIFHLSGWAHNGVIGRRGGSHNHPGFEALVDALTPVEWTSEEWVRSRINNGNYILERLLDSKKITKEDISLILDGE